MRCKYRLAWLLQFANVSRSGYYKWRHTQEAREVRQQRDQVLKEHILAVHKIRPFYGYFRMQIALRKEGISVNHKRVYRLMKELRIQSTIRKKRRYFATKPSIVHPNRLNRKFYAESPKRVLVTDITYIAFQNRFYYLSAVQDLYNNEIVAWKVSTRNDLRLVMDTVEELQRIRDKQETLLHSDQGFQYTSKSYNNRLKAYGIVGSHSRKGNCLDNACIESFFSHLKTETDYFSTCQTSEELLNAIEQYILFYNHERFQKKLNQCTPVEYRNTLAA